MSSPPLTDPGPPPLSPARPVSRSDRFFSWTAGLGIVRGDGWIGGVAAGLSARLGIDPLIVRGILIVIALFGFPALVLYAIAWALLPDLDGRIVAQEALRGRFTPALVGVGVFALAGLLPAPLALFVGLPTLGVWNGAGDLLSLAATLIVLGVAAVAGLLVFLIVRSARSAPVSAPHLAPAAAPAPDDAVTAESHGSEHLDGASAFEAGDESTPADPETEMAAWRAQHAAWREQDQLWRQQQQDAARAAREQARRERQAAATAFATEAAERRRHRRAVNPRAPFAYVAAAVGAAVVLGTVVALQQGLPLAPATGLFVAAAVLGAAMVLAGILRRRSGFLAFATALTLVGGVGAMALPAATALHVGSYGISNYGTQPEYSAEEPFLQPWGGLTITLDDTGRTGEIHVVQRNGTAFIAVAPGVEVTVVATTRWSGVYVTRSSEESEFDTLADAPGAVVDTLPDGRTRYTATFTNGDGPATTREHVVIEQDSGYIDVYLQDPPEPTDADLSETDGVQP